MRICMIPAANLKAMQRAQGEALKIFSAEIEPNEELLTSERKRGRTAIINMGQVVDAILDWSHDVHSRLRSNRVSLESVHQWAKELIEVFGSLSDDFVWHCDTIKNHTTKDWLDKCEVQDGSHKPRQSGAAV